MRKRWLAVAMATTLTFTSIVPSQYIHAALDSNYAKSELTVSTGETKKQTLSNNSLKNSLYQEDDEVTIIVELKENSLLDRYDNGISTYRAKSYYTDVKSYLDSDEAELSRNEMLQAQKKVADNIKNMNKARSTSSEVLYNYTTIMNGFAMKVKYGQLDKIKRLSGVKTAYVARTYELEPNMTTSNEMIESEVAHALNYNGEGTVVAILDTGLDTNHEAFSADGLSDEGKASVKVTESEVSGAKSTDGVADGRYVSTKVPFAYDYADGDDEVTPSVEAVENFGNDHGTHVAGTVAGNSETIKGVAPQAQLMIMKVFSDSDNGASTEDILAGLEDAVNLNADAINMSLGSANGYSVGEEEGVQEVYDRIVEAGINLAVSAGNSYSASYSNEAYGAFTSNPDTSIVGSPSTYAASTSVASTINTHYYAHYFKLGNQELGYSETATGSQPTFTGLDTTGNGTTYDYVVVPKNGDVADYEGIDVTGKIAVVNRGGTTFNEKVVNAASGGAIAVVVANNQDGTINMAIDDYVIPAVSVTKVQGNELKKASEKKITVYSELGHYPSKDAKKMSDFSSWGVTPDLKLKPEITAPGENIYSSLPFNNSYGSMSGTSMAAPHIAGTFALVKQYIDEEGLVAVKGGNAELANQLLMSTAVPLTDEKGDYYSPRKQGSGLVNVGNAVTTPAYLYVDDESINYRPKLDLKDSTEGVYEADFVVQSVTGSAITYKLKANTLTETADEYGYILEQSEDISEKVTIEYTGDGVEDNTVTVPAGASATVHVKITLSDYAKSYINDNFANGEFVEGFIFLTSDEGDEALSLPFMGFYGDWAKAPLMDSSTVYDNNTYGTGDNKLYQQTTTFLLADEATHLLGVNPYDEWAYYLLGSGINAYDYNFKDYMLQLDPNKIAISPNDDGYNDDLYATQFSLLRNARTIKSTITDTNKKVVYENSWEYDTKSTYNSGTGTVSPAVDMPTWKPTTINNNDVYTYTISGALDYSGSERNLKSSISFPITIDVETPTVKNLKIVKENDKVYATFDVTDNQYVAYAGLYDLSGKSITVIDQEEGEPVAVGELVNESTKAATTTMKLELTDYVGATKDNFIIRVCDYAGNEKAFTYTQEGNLPGSNNGGSEGGSPVPQIPTPQPGSGVVDDTIELETKADATEIKPADIKEAIDNKDVTEIKVVVTQKEASHIIKLTKETLDAIVAANKNLTIQIKDANGKVIGTWTFKAADVKNVTGLYSNIILNVKSTTVEGAKQADSTIGKIFGNASVNGLYVELDQKQPLGAEGKLTVSLAGVEAVSKGSRVYIYCVNEKTGKLETIVGGYSQSVNSDNTITFPVLDGGKYVVLTAKANSKKITSLQSQITVKAKSKTVKKGKSTTVVVDLPACLQVVTKLSDKTTSGGVGAVTISYKTSNKGVATVNKSGKITAKKKGTTTITAKISLYNGKTKTVKMKITVK
ncbi:S8 family serine peptidase [Anaerosporobacter sp.]